MEYPKATDRNSRDYTYWINRLRYGDVVGVGDQNYIKEKGTVLEVTDHVIVIVIQLDETVLYFSEKVVVDRQGSGFGSPSFRSIYPLDPEQREMLDLLQLYTDISNTPWQKLTDTDWQKLPISQLRSIIRTVYDLVQRK